MAASDEKKNGRISLSTVGLAVAIIGGPLAVWGESQLERGSTKERLATIEKRQHEDRKDTRTAITEVKEHVKLIDHNTQIILQKITAMEAVQRNERDRQR
jgi:Na+/glutamate symporter